MPRKRRGSRSEDDSDSTFSSSEGESSDSEGGSKKSNHRRSRKDDMSRSSPSRYVKHDRDHRQQKESNKGQRQTSSSKHQSLDSSRGRSPAQEMRRSNSNKSDMKRRGEKDRQYEKSVNRRSRDTDMRKVGENKDRMDRRQRSRDREHEKSKRGKDSRSTSYSREKNSRNLGIKDGENYLRQQTDAVRKDKNLDNDTRKVRNDDKDDRVNTLHKSTSKDFLKEKEELRGGLHTDILKAGDKIRRDDKKSLPEKKKVKLNEKENEKKRKVSASSSSNSSSEDNSSESDSAVKSADGRRNDSKRVESSKESAISPLMKPEIDNTRKSEEIKAAGIENKKSENTKEDNVEREHGKNHSEPDSDNSVNEKEQNTSKYKKGHCETEESTEIDVHKNIQTDVSKAVTSEKQLSVSQERSIITEGRDGASEDEKEEGELSEDNEDKIPDNKPLKAISDYVSDISSDDGQPDVPEPTEIQPQPTPQLQAKPTASHIPTEISKESDRNIKQLNKPSKVDKTEKKAGTKNKEVAEFRSGSSETRKRNNFSDHEVVDGEDNSKRQRPVLESESDDDDRDKEKSSVRSKTQSKQKIGSSVLIVRKELGRRDRDRSGGRDGSRGRAWEDSRRKDNRERDNRERDARPRPDTDREKKRDGNIEAKRPSDRSEQKDIPNTNAGKPENIIATKTTEEPAKKPVIAFDITSKTGGAYIPPAKLRMMQELITDKTSVAYQRMSWEALKKSINGLVNKVNVSNAISIVKELFQENIVRGRGLLARSVIQAQAASPTFTHVYAALVAIINTKFPQNGELILRRLILMFRRGFKRNDKALCLSTTTFIAHLVNQQVAHEVLALEILTLLLENPTDDSVEISVGFLKECGLKLTEVSPRGINSIFERLRNVLHEGLLDVRVQYMVEVMFAVRKDGFKDHPSVLKDLDLVEEEDQFTHLLQLEDAVTGDELLNVFKEDPAFAENEEKYKTLKKEILDEGSSDEDAGDSSGSGSSESDSDDEEKKNAEKQIIIDATETNLIALRRNIYLTIQSSLDHNECAHKMLKMELKPGQEVELCNMILDCCAQLRTYEKFYGLLAQRFCQIDRKYIEPFQQIFVDQYETIHRLETNKLRNVAKFFAHMLHTDAISWGVLSVIKLAEEDTTSASRIFLKILFQELSEYLGLTKLNERLKDPTLSPYFSGIMARDNPKNTRFCINFFTTIGLGGLTDDLREHLKTATKQIAQQNLEADQEEREDISSSSQSSSDSSDSDSSSDSESDTSSKRKHKSSSRTKKKAEKDHPKSKKKATEKENRKASRRARVSSDRDSKSESRSRSSGKGGTLVNDKNVPADKNKRTIADRLLDMAQYGNIRNGDERSRERSDRFDKENEIRPHLNRRDDKDSRSEREEWEFESRENGERLAQNNRRFNSYDDREGRRQEDNMGYRNKGGEDERRKGGRQYEGNFRRREDNFHQPNDSSWDRISDNARRGRNEYDREDVKRDKEIDGDRGQAVHRGEKRKERRHASSSEDSESSPEQVRKRHGRGRNLSATPEKRNRKQSLETDIVPKQGSKKRPHKYSTSNAESISDSSDDDRSKSSKSKRDNRDSHPSKTPSNMSQKDKRKKSLSSSGSHTSSSSSSSSSDDETTQERRIITKKPRLGGDKDLRRPEEILDKRSGENDKAKRRR